MVAMYVGTREENVERGLRDHRRASSAALRDRGRLAARSWSAPRSTSRAAWCSASSRPAARMARIARAILFDVPLLSLDEMLARVDAVTARRAGRARRELYDPERLSAACIGPERGALPRGAAAGQRGAGRAASADDPRRRLRRRRAHGGGRLRGGRGRRRHGARRPRRSGARRRARRGARTAPTWSSTSRRPTTALANVARSAWRPASTRVVGTTGFDLDELRGAAEAAARRRRERVSSPPTSRSAPC